MLEKWGIYSFFFLGHMNSGSMYNFSFCFYSNDHLFWGALFPQTPSDSDQTRRIWLFVALQALQPQTPSPHKTQHPQTTLPLWRKRDGHQQIYQWKPASIPPQINFLCYIFTNPLPMAPCLALPQLLQPFSHPRYPCLRLSPLSFSPCCISPCPQPLIHASHLWPSGWEQVERQVIIQIFMSGSLCLEMFPGGVVTLRKKL